VVNLISLRHLVTGGCFGDQYLWILLDVFQLSEALLDLNEFKSKLYHLGVSTDLFQPWFWLVVLCCSFDPELNN
jgi:hypothetical protein